jgi:hypothetical protein
MKGFIFSKQATLFGHKDVIGFGDDVMTVMEVPRAKANSIVRKNHYSRKIVSTSTVHLGVFIKGLLSGVLQYGVAMNPASGGSIVSGTEIGDYLELNRMWLSDAAPRNSESKAISFSIKYIKRRYPRVAWIQSFADERCGGLGIVYQAANFDYYGEHTSVFWELDGEVYHNSIATNGARAHTKSATRLRSGFDRAVELRLRQFRYIFFIKRSAKRRCMLKRQPYPKHYMESGHE